MKRGQWSNELQNISHLIMLIMMTVFTLLITLLNRILGWELWVLPILFCGVVVCWGLYITRRESIRLLTYASGIFFILEVFYYIVNAQDMNDGTAIVIVMLFLFAITRETVLLPAGVIGAYAGLIMRLIVAGSERTLTYKTTEILDVIWQFLIIGLTAFIAKQIVTAWHTAENGYQQELTEVRAENGRVNNFLANVSHEIRTPVNAVMGLSAVLEKENLPKHIADNISAISDAGHRVAEQISDILDFTEVDMDKLAVGKESYIISSVVNDLLVQLSFMENYGLELVVDLEAGIPAELIGDESKIKKILWHLIGNGFKFTKEGGVYVHIYSVKRKYGINLCLEVVDTGSGMTEDEIEHIYEKFYQSDSGRSRTAGGLGLGIPIVNGFVKSMGGMLAVESTPGYGSLFRVSIPQKVVNEDPCISIRDRENCVVAGFLGFMTTTSPRVRSFYMDMIAHLVAGFGVPFFRVQSREELEKLIESEKISHLFVGTGEYKENVAYIDNLAKKINVAVVADPGFDVKVGSGVMLMHKPFYGGQVATVLNHSMEESTANAERMMCPDIRALVVDDEPMNLLVAKGIFETYGMVVSTVNSGQEALEVCQTEDFDIIFMDHMMPEMDGVEAMKRLRTQAAKEKKELCIVALTANAISSAKEMFLSEGFDGFVAKPVEIIELERVLKHVLPKNAIVYEKVEEKEYTAEITYTKKEDDQTGQETPMEALERNGVDTTTGLKYCQNDENFYRELLLEYAKDKDNKLANLSEYFEKEKWEDYTIRVHAIKSTSKMIGALALSEQAKDLEQASKIKDEQAIFAFHPTFFASYKVLMELIDKLYCEKKDDTAGEEVLEFGPDAGEVLEFGPDADDGALEFAPEEVTDASGKGGNA
ncbi:MAG: response regulator [Lachnospiraceae bacterium]|nr:response regulator [Lachnospiraceae bacterium]